MAESIKICKHNIDGFGSCDIAADGVCVQGPCHAEELVEYAPVVHGEWRTIGANFDRLFCSSCGQAALPNVKMLAHFAITFKFCPLCGAKMDGGDSDGR